MSATTADGNFELISALRAEISTLRAEIDASKVATSTTATADAAVVDDDVAAAPKRSTPATTFSKRVGLNASLQVISKTESAGLMHQNHCMKDLRARMKRHGVCTNYAVQQILVAEHIQEIKRRGEEDDKTKDTADATDLPSPTRIFMSKIRRRFSQPHQNCDAPRSLTPIPSLATLSTTPEDERSLIKAFRRRSDENLRKLAYQLRFDTLQERLDPAMEPPNLQRSRSADVRKTIHNLVERSTNNNPHERQQRPLLQRALSFCDRAQSKHDPPPLQYSVSMGRAESKHGPPPLQYSVSMGRAESKQGPPPLQYSVSMDRSQSKHGPPPLRYSVSMDAQSKHGPPPLQYSVSMDNSCRPSNRKFSIAPILRRDKNKGEKKDAT